VPWYREAAHHQYIKTAKGIEKPNPWYIKTTYGKEKP